MIDALVSATGSWVSSTVTGLTERFFTVLRLTGFGSSVAGGV